MDTLMPFLAESECSSRCHSTQHGRSLTSALSLRGISCSVTASYIHWQCNNCGQVVDHLGRSALHMAASCGSYGVAQWLVRQCKARLDQKDVESGYTPLHRSVFYGQLHVAIKLIQLGASVTCMDYDNLTALDHAMKDRMPYVEFTRSNPCEVYAWGTNDNYNLGIGNQPKRNVPEIVDFFRKDNISIKQVAMNKFHSVFVAHGGRVFSCGHGLGGRLGLHGENSAVIPGELKLVSSASGTDTHVVAASVGRDHTVLLTEGGSVWTCGSNAHHQLGHSPPPAALSTPKALSPRTLHALEDVRGVCAGRFHTVIWGSKGIMTCGMHAGQLGHCKDRVKTQIIPRVVTAVNKGCQIMHVAASDGATVFVTSKGDIFVLHEYDCRRIASRLLNVVKVEVVGGHLDSSVFPNILLEHAGQQLKVAAITSSGNLLLWQEASQQMVRCTFSLDRPLGITDAVLSRGNIVLLATKDGEAFEGEVKTRKVKKATSPPAATPAFHEFLNKSECEQVRVRRLAHIHRAVSVHLDPKGRNFAVIQTHPQAALLAVPSVETSEIREQMRALLHEASVADVVHDVVFIVGQKEFAAHRFVIASQSEPLAKLIECEILDSGSKVPHVNVKNVNADVFEQILMYIYTGECDLSKLILKPEEGNENHENLVNLNCVSTNQINSQISNKKAKNKQDQKKQMKKNQKKQIKQDQSNKNPLKELQGTARRFGLRSLHQKLNDVHCKNGVVNPSTSLEAEDRSFDRMKYLELSDITLKCEDGMEIKAHKCMLIARSEYFNCMLNHGWLESAPNNIQQLPVPRRVLELLIDFLYTNDCTVVKKSDDLDLVSNVLVLADQLFTARLKEICEVTLSGMITLRNVAMILQFSYTYNANQLKHCCMQYICLNLSAVLELRGLENVDESLLKELSEYYRDFNPVLSRRVITPYSDAPKESIVEAIAEAFPIDCMDLEESNEIESSSKKATKAGKRRGHVREISFNDTNKKNERNRNESLSSNHSLHSEDDLNFTEIIDKQDDSNKMTDVRKMQTLQESLSTKEWVTVKSNNKHTAQVKNLLKAMIIMKEDHSVMHTNENLSKLVKNTEVPGTCLAKSQHTSPETNLQACPNSNIPPSVPVPLPCLIADFPILNSPPHHTTSPEDSPPKTSIHRMKSFPKVSQKQRKKMAELGEKQTSFSHIAWNTSNEQSLTSLLEIMHEDAKQNKQGSDPIPVMPSNGSAISAKQESLPLKNPWVKSQPISPVGSPETMVKFCDIIADERKQRTNWTKMIAKPLELTQLEDRAIEDLLACYNAAGVSDERITVRRVITGNVAAPTWIKPLPHH